jgi:hypothetical protein
MPYIPKYFKIEELTPPDICNPNDVNQWFLFDDRILWTADQLRKRYGTLVLNTWKWGGTHTFRGFRSWACQVGSRNSQHKLGRALDIIPTAEVTVEEIRNEIIANPTREEFKFITAIESDVSWLHIDCRNYDKARNGLLIFSNRRQ